MAHSLIACVGSAWLMHSVNVGWQVRWFIIIIYISYAIPYVECGQNTKVDFFFKNNAMLVDEGSEKLPK